MVGITPTSDGRRRRVGDARGVEPFGPLRPISPLRNSVLGIECEGYVDPVFLENIYCFFGSCAQPLAESSHLTNAPLHLRGVPCHTAM
jgi:hypothetical protein